MRKSLLLGLSGCCGLILLALGEGAAQQKTPDQAAQAKRFYEIRSSLAKRVNGALLQTKVIVAPKAADADDILIGWTLDYDGPRPPLTILQPMLEQRYNQTTLIVYAEDKNHRVYEYETKKPYQLYWDQPSAKSLFVTVERGKQSKGSITLSAAVLYTHFRGWPKVFGDTPPPLYLQLRHKPTERGKNHNLDAWTGELFSRVVKFSVTRWHPTRKGF